MHRQGGKNGGALVAAAQAGTSPIGLGPARDVGAIHNDGTFVGCYFA